MNLNSRIFLDEPSDERSDESATNFHRSAYAQVSLDGFASRGRLRLSLGYIRNDASATLVKQVALFGKLKCSGRACDQAHAKTRLECAKAPAHGCG